MASDANSISTPAVEFYVLKDGDMLGPFSKEQLQEGLREGHFTPADFAQTEGETTWISLGTILGIRSKEARGAVAPDWKTILKWAWVRFRNNLDQQSFVVGLALLAIGAVAIVLTRWPLVFWIPSLAGSVAASIALLKHGKKLHGALLLVGVVCIPLLFVLLGSTAGVRPARAATTAQSPEANTNKSAVPTEPPSNLEPASLPATPAALASAVIPEPVTPHYAKVADESAPPAATPAPAVAVPAPTDPEPEPKEIDFVQTYSDSLVLIKGNEGSGSGFICNNGTASLLYTNIHVLAGIKQPSMTTMNGAAVTPGTGDIAAARDIARFELSKLPAHPLETIKNFESNVSIGDEVVVLGNSGGGGVVTSITGKVVGIGPDRVEVSAEFIPGNSGSPIIHVKTGTVIGIATYLTKRYDNFANSGSGAVVVRRYGYRLDNNSRWETLRWAEFRQDADTMGAVSALTADIFDFFLAMQSGGTPKFSTDTLRRPAMDFVGRIHVKHLSRADKLSAVQGFLNSLRFMVRTDVTTAEQRLRYSYFRDELHKEREIRDRLYKAFDEESQKLSL